MKHNIVKVCIVLLLLSILTGCWSRRELNELGIVVAIGFDKTEDERIQVSVQLVNPGEIARNGGAVPYTPVTTYSTSAPTVFEAMRQLTKEAPRLLYYPHAQIVVIGEELAREGIKSVLDLISRDHEFRADFYIVVAKGEKARSTLDVLTQMEKIPANKMFTSLKMSDHVQGSVTKVTLDQLINYIVNDGKEPALPGIAVIGNKEGGKREVNIRTVEPFARLNYETIAVFSSDKLVGWLNEQESIGYNYITDNIDSTVNHVICQDEKKLVYELLRSQTKVEASMQGGEPTFLVRVDAEGNVGEVHCRINLNEEKTFKMLEEKIEENIRSQISSAIETVQTEYRSDIFGFGAALHKKYPQQWKTLKNNWNEKFAEVAVEIDVNMHLRRTGSVNNSFIKKTEQ